MKATLQGLLLMTAGLIAALLAGEFLIRHIAPQGMYRFPQGMFVNDDFLRYRLTPKFHGVSETVEFKTDIVTNSLGLREANEYAAKAPDVFRILSLGDSFAMGVGVEGEDAMAKVLETLLSKQAPGKRYEVINAGVPGYDTRQAIEYLQRRGLALHPDLVLLQFYVGNDISDNYHAPPLTVVDGYLREGVPPDGVLPSQIRDYLQRKSHLYQFLWLTAHRFMDASWREKEREKLERHLSIYSVNETESARSMWEASRRLLAELQATAKAKGVNVLVVVIPDPMQVDERKWKEAIRASRRNAAYYQAEKPGRRIAEYCNQLGVPVLDLLPVFVQEKSGAPTYYQIDGHWTKRGNAMAAEAARDFLTAQPLTRHALLRDSQTPLGQNAQHEISRRE